MDATELAERLLLSVPANVTLGVAVTRAIDGDAEVTVDVPIHLTNVIGSMHASGLAGLVDACALAAIISAMDGPEDVRDLLPLGRSVQLRFTAPARGTLTARCRLDEAARTALHDLDQVGKARLSTTTTIESDGAEACVGTFEWTVRRSPA